VAIVDAYDDPNVAADLAVYRSYFSLPAASFTKYNQKGQTGDYPPASVGWASEESLDVDMVSASCPNCSIALIEANSAKVTDLEASVDEAVALGAHIVSNSYACYKRCGLKRSHYDVPGITFVAGSGDWGYGVGIDGPAQFDSVVAAGGTALYVDHNTKRGFREKAWFGATSGCTGEIKPSWQHDPGCSRRTATDVASLADPTTGPNYYDTYGYSGWGVGGGTSAASPFLAGIFALAGNAMMQNGGETFWHKSHEGSEDLNHIAAGENGSCTPSYLCEDGTHEYRSYGGPTGWGTPNGVGAF
jgi:subtilase family serine protease